jgi:hypothetical protein
MNFGARRETLSGLVWARIQNRSPTCDILSLHREPTPSRDGGRMCKLTKEIIESFPSQVVRQYTPVYPRGLPLLFSLSGFGGMSDWAL